MINFSPATNNLAEYEGVHPRLFYTESDFERVRQDIAAGGTAADIWKLAKAHADKYYGRELPDFESKDSGENLWISEEGAKIQSFAFAYKISGDKKYLDKAIALADRLLSFPYWATKGSDGDFNELAAEGAFIGISLLYDWCYHDLEPQKRTEIANALAVRGESMKRFDWYRAAYLQNHLHQCAAALLVTAMAIYDVYDGTGEWIEAVNSRMQKTVEYITPDGAGAEGHMYHSETMHALVMTGILNEKFLNINMLDAEVFKNTSKYTVYNSLPANALYYWRDQFYYGDASYYSYFAMAPYTAYLADRYNDHGAMEYIENSVKVREQAYTVDKTDDIFRTDEWMLLRYYNPEFSGIPLEELKEEYPTDYVFADTGYGYTRQDWSGDEEVIAVRSGPILGTKAADYSKNYMYDLGVGHQHPDQGHFQIYSETRWIFSDDGYTTGYTKNHSTLLVNGLGQFGCKETYAALSDSYTSGEWADKWNQAKPTLKIVASDDKYAHMVADITPAYPAETKLTKFIRNYVYLKDERALVVIDSVAASEESEFSFRFRPHNEFGLQSKPSSTKYRYFAGSTTSSAYRLDIEFQTPDGTKLSTKETLYSGKSGGTTEAFVAKNTITAKEAVNVTAISWCNRNTAPGTNPATVTVTDKGNFYTISAGSTTVNVKIEK